MAAISQGQQTEISAPLKIGFHKEDFRKNSWYWNDLRKQYGSWKKAEEAVRKSQERYLRLKTVNFSD